MPATNTGDPLSGRINTAPHHASSGTTERRSTEPRLTDPYLADARRLLASAPAAAVAAAKRATTGSPAVAAFVLGAALRRTGDLDAALAQLAPLAESLPRVWGVHYELGMTLAGTGDIATALGPLGTAAALNPQSSLVLRALGDMLELLDRPAEARAVHARPVAASAVDPRLAAAAAAWLRDGDAALLAGLGLYLTDIGAVCLVAEAGLRTSAVEAVAAMLAAALAVTPGYLPARHALALALFRLERSDEALTAVDTVLAAAPVAAVRALRAAIRMQRGEVAAAIDDFTAAAGRDPLVWHGFGHALRAAGRQSEAVAAYRRALALDPSCTEAFWSLANLKTWRFSPGDRAAMTAALATAPDDDRAHLHFALGKAEADAGRIAASFAHYVAGNAARRATLVYDRAAHDDFVARTIATFTADFLAERAGSSDPAPDAIFIVGLPRSGSTLVEQILASHPQVDGLSELHDLPRIARAMATPYPDALSGLATAAFARAGRAYLAATRRRRTLGRTRFVDKFPGNFLHTGLIHLILPGATIVDVRRDPLATCFSLFRQLFAHGQSYAYDFDDLAHYYRSYLALMDHFAAVLPGRVLTLSYEALVADSEAETRRLLAHAGLAFDLGCLRFFESDRPVRTASSEQVRQPISRAGLDDWRRFEPWLGPLRDALGPLAPPPTAATMLIFDSPIR